MTHIVTEKIIRPEQLEAAYRIRNQVFVVEQNVPADEEYDEFEATSTHFLASINGEAVGTCRWRFTDKGIKLERFAVLDSARGKQVGWHLLQAALADIAAQGDKSLGKTRYLHAQTQVIPFYEKAGFTAVGEIFSECDILHRKMILEG